MLRRRTHSQRTDRGLGRSPAHQRVDSSRGNLDVDHRRTPWQSAARRQEGRGAPLQWQRTVHARVSLATIHPLEQGHRCGHPTMRAQRLQSHSESSLARRQAYGASRGVDPALKPSILVGTGEFGGMIRHRPAHQLRRSRVPDWERGYITQGERAAGLLALPVAEQATPWSVGRLRCRRAPWWCGTDRRKRWPQEVLWSYVRHPRGVTLRPDAHRRRGHVQAPVPCAGRTVGTASSSTPLPMAAGTGSVRCGRADRA